MTIAFLAVVMAFALAPSAWAWVKRHTCAVLVIAALLATPAWAKSPKPRKMKKPAVTLYLSPNGDVVGLAPLVVNARMVIEDPDQQLLSCPDYAIEWGDGDAFQRSTWCDGLLPQDQRPKRYVQFDRHCYRYPGVFGAIATIGDRWGSVFTSRAARAEVSGVALQPCPRGIP